MLPKHPDQMSDDELRLWVEHLVRDEVEEGPRLDYKATQALAQPNDRREVARDASSFANEVGGILLYGIAEQANSSGRPIPTSPYGIKPIPDFESRVEDILVDSIRPTLPEWRIRMITANKTDVVYVVWIPESWIGVHMVESYGDHRFYRRGNYRQVQMSEQEVRERYDRVRSAKTHLVDFLESRELNYLESFLPSDEYRSQYVLVPHYPVTVDFNSPEMIEWASQNPYPPYSLEASAYGVRTKLDVGSGSRAWGPRIEVYRNGALCLWRPARIGSSKGRDVLAWKAEIRHVREFLQYSQTFLQVLRYYGPIEVRVNIDHPVPHQMRDVHLPIDDYSDYWEKLMIHSQVLRADVSSSGAALIADEESLAKDIADQWFRAFGSWKSPM